MINANLNINGAKRRSAIAAEVKAYIDGLVTPLSLSQVKLIDTFVKEVKSGLGIDNLSDAFDVMYILANETEESSLRNLVKRAHDAEEVPNGGALTFESLKGFTSDGNAYIKTNYTPATQGVNYSLNDASQIIYVRNHVSDGAYDCGGYLSSNYSVLNIKDTVVYFVNTSGVSSFTNRVDNAGLSVASRPNATTQKYFLNKFEEGSDTDSSTSIPQVEYYICCYKNGSVPSARSTKSYSFYAAGKSLTESQVKVIHDAIANLPLFFWAAEPFYYFPPTTDNEGIPLLIGESYRIYGNTLCNLATNNNMSAEYNCEIGSINGKDFITIPNAGDLGLNTLGIKIKDNGITVIDDSTHLKVYEKAASGTKSILTAGDSLIALGYDHEFSKVESILNNVTFTTIGTQSLGGYNHEGFSGRTYEWATTNADSPFTKAGVLDIPAYFTDNGLSTPDFVYLRYGVNDINAYTNSGLNDTRINTIMGYIDSLVDAFLAYDVNIQVIVGLPTICTKYADVYDAAYPGEHTYNGKIDYYVKNMHKFWKAIMPKYRNGNYNARVFTCYAPLFLDRGDGYLNALHPNDEGYAQLGIGLAATLNKLI